MFSTPAPGFDEPLALLGACHERILRQCATLQAMADQLAHSGLTQELREAATAIHRYFSLAGLHHHEDEEQDLFPLLRGDEALATLIESLEQEHSQINAMWHELEPLLAAPDTIRDPAAFQRLVMAFNTLQVQHVERENQTLLPRAASLLPPAVLAVLGARMAARRGISL